MASGSDRDAEYALFESFNFGRSLLQSPYCRGPFEDEWSTTDIAKTNDLNAGVQVQDLEETIRHKPDKVEAFQTKKDDAKPPISTDTFGSNGGNDSRTSSSETPAKEVVDNGIESEVVVGLPEEFQKGDMVDALSRVEQKKGKENQLSWQHLAAIEIENVKDEEGKNVEDQQVFEQTINETANTITSLQSEVASLEAKGSLDANKEIKKTHTRVHELEK
ncbi:hypothetical protein Tco_1078622 [Tanacetum coccineum]|uniref:Uncharacterized protein n=1 Tax=Tanacetum coccineum TaxID=301880 RepID=A0ABQ5HPI3_9ASTR